MKINFTYFTSILVFLSVSLTHKISAQSYTFNPGVVFNMVVDTNQANFDGIEIQNTGTQNLNLSWRLFSVDTLIDSRFELCNSGICFMNLAANGNMPAIAPGGTGWLKFHIISGQATGLNTIKYVLKNGHLQTDTLTFNITVANTTGFNELTKSKDKINVFPNPAKAYATVGFNLIESSDVTLTITNTLGQTAEKSVTNYNAGAHTVRLDTDSWTPGIYNIVVATKNGTSNQKLVITK